LGFTYGQEKKKKPRKREDSKAKERRSRKDELDDPAISFKYSWLPGRLAAASIRLLMLRKPIAFRQNPLLPMAHPMRDFSIMPETAECQPLAA
jgi:hypothetical protein